jgi:hypothetical protein
MVGEASGTDRTNTGRALGCVRADGTGHTRGGCIAVFVGAASDAQGTHSRGARSGVGASLACDAWGGDVRVKVGPAAGAAKGPARANRSPRDKGAS